VTDAVGVDFGQSECRLAHVVDGQSVALKEVTRLTQVWLRFNDQIKIPKIHDKIGPGVKAVACDVKSDLGDRQSILLGRRAVAPIDLAAKVIQAVREEGERRIGRPLRRAMIVVPTRASEPRRAATRAAAQAAGFPETKLISETLAAAIFARSTGGGDGWYLVYHLGAGPFEAALIRVDGQRYEVTGITGDNDVNGRRFDRLIATHFAEQMRQQGKPLPDDRSPASQAIQAVLLRWAEGIKIQFAKRSQWRSTLAGLIRLPDGRSADVELVVKRAEFERWIRPAIDTTFDQVQHMLAEANLAAPDLKAILTVGSTAVLPLVEQVCMEVFDHAPTPLDAYAVAQGAAIHAQTVPADQWAATAAPPSPHRATSRRT